MTLAYLLSRLSPHFQPLYIWLRPRFLPCFRRFIFQQYLTLALSSSIKIKYMITSRTLLTRPLLSGELTGTLLALSLPLLLFLAPLYEIKRGYRPRGL